MRRVFEHCSKSVPLQDNTVQDLQDSTDHTKRLEYFQGRSSYDGDLVPREKREDFHRPEQQDSKTRLVAKVLRDVLAGETFEGLADLTDALKCRCQRLRIRWTNDAISGAYRLVGSNHPLVTRPTVATVATVPPEPPVLARREAAELWGKVVDHFGPRAFKALPRRGFSPVVIEDTRTDDVVDVESLYGGMR